MLVIEGNKAVMLLRSDAGHRLEPMGIMRGSLLHGPLLHRLCDFIRCGKGKGRTVTDAFLPLLIAGGRKAHLHCFFVENHASEKGGEVLGAFVHRSNPHAIINCLISYLYHIPQNMKSKERGIYRREKGTGIV